MDTNPKQTGTRQLRKKCDRPKRRITNHWVHLRMNKKNKTIPRNNSCPISATTEHSHECCTSTVNMRKKRNTCAASPHLPQVAIWKDGTGEWPQKTSTIPAVTHLSAGSSTGHPGAELNEMATIYVEQKITVNFEQKNYHKVRADKPSRNCPT